MHFAQQHAAETPGTLLELAAEVRRTRDDVRARRMDPLIRNDLVLAHRSLLQAMEAYAFELTDHHLPIPSRLRDELRLHRRIARQTTWPPTPWALANQGPSQ